MVRNTQAMSNADSRSDKGFVAVLLLCLFFGAVGAHRYYTGKVVTGLLMLMTVGGVGIWIFVDLLMILTGNFADAKGLKISNR